MPIVLKSSLDLAVAHGVKVLVYSGAGFGKTSLCATAPAPIILSAESGLLCLRKKNLEKMYGVGNPTVSYNTPVIEINDLADLTDAFDWCARSAEANQFATVCLDSISDIAEAVLSNAKKKAKDPRQAYGELLEKVGETIKKFRDLSQKNVYMAAKQGFIKDEATGVLKYGPLMPGSKLGPQIPYLYDEVFNLNIAKADDLSTYRYLLTQPDLQYDAKDRSGSLDTIEKPDLTHIFNKIIGDH